VGQAVGAPCASLLGIASTEISTGTSSAAQWQRARSQQRPTALPKPRQADNITLRMYWSLDSRQIAPSTVSMKLLITLAVLAAVNACTGKCETKKVNVGTCKLEVKACGCVEDFKLKYKATGRDLILFCRIRCNISCNNLFLICLFSN
jgi:hypothetical protein